MTHHMRKEGMPLGGQDLPGFIISALGGGSGKTILATGIIAALNKKGVKVAPFKKGPDYIDAGWLSLAAGCSCYNLDTFLIPGPDVVDSFHRHASPCDLSVIEGNRGLYDSIHADGRGSTAELAKMLGLPVILCLNCSKVTRTMAAIVMGCLHFDPEVKIKGVVLNRIAGKRHEKNIRKNIETYTDVPVIGAIPKLSDEKFPERHMGLVPTYEHEWAAESIQAIGQVISDHVDLDAALDIAASGCKKGSLSIASFHPSHHVEDDQNALDGVCSPNSFFIRSHGKTSRRARIGIALDSAFQFYYPENIDALFQAGAEPVFISPLKDKIPPPIDALYLGGGFPETHAEQLSDNATFRASIKQMAEEGMPIYAECGGLMYLGQEIVLSEKSYSMTDVLPVVYGFSKRPQGHGYTIVHVDKPNPYFAVGSKIMGHEFHYSFVLKWMGSDDQLVFSMDRGAGFYSGKDGASVKNVLGTYTHIHALGETSWAESLLGNAEAFKKNRLPVSPDMR